MTNTLLNLNNVNSSITDCYKKISLYNDNHQNNKAGVVFTSSDIARNMISKLNPTMDETVFEPSVGTGVFVMALLEFIIEKYSPADIELKQYLENKVYFSDIDKDSVNFTKKLVKDFMFSAYNVNKLSLNAFVQDSLLNTKHFDLIIGNPPYIRTKNIEKQYLQFLRTNFHSCEGGNIDIYYAFVELANNFSNRSSLIVPNSYLKNVSAKKLRALIKPNISFIRDFKDSKQFMASTYTTILMLNIKATDLFSYAKYDEEASLFKREVLNADTWNIDTAHISHKYESRGTRLSDIADIYSGINTNADKLFIIDKSTLGQGYYKKSYMSKEYLIEQGICLDLIKISKRFSTSLNQAIIFPYTEINSIIEEQILATQYPQSYLYLLAIKSELGQRDRGNTKNYDAWYAYGRRQGFNVDFTAKKCFLVPIVYKSNNFLYEKYRPLKRFVHTSGFVIVPKYGCLKQVEDILNSSDFKRYLSVYGTIMPGSDVHFNKVSANILKKYPYLSAKSISYAA